MRDERIPIRSTYILIHITLEKVCPDINSMCRQKSGEVNVVATK